MGFIEDSSALYVKHNRSTVLNSILIAQDCLESNYGKSELAVNADNYGGIKANKPWSGDTYTKLTQEWDGTKYILVKAEFAKFSSMEEFVKYHSNFFTSTPWRANYYGEVLRATTYQGQAEALTGTYATDPSYAQKIIKVIEELKLTKYDKEKSGDNVVGLRTPIRKITRVNSFGRGSNKPKFIVIHYVGADGSAASNANYFYSVNRNASAHYFIDKVNTYQVVEEDAGAWHVGDGNTTRRGEYNGYITPGLCTNYNSIGLEMCLTPIPGKPVTDWAIDPIVVEQTRLLTLALMKKYNIPASNVIRHFDVSTKLCPAPWRFNNWAKWKEFKQSLKAGATAKEMKTIDRFVKLPEYKSPSNPFTQLKVGESVTIREGMSAWYDPQTKEGVSPSKDFAGDKDTIKKVMSVDVGYSKRAYLLKEKNSWILEQDLVEPRANWVEVKDNLTDEEKQSDRYIMWDGKRYEIVEK